MTSALFTTSFVILRLRPPFSSIISPEGAPLTPVYARNSPPLAFGKTRRDTGVIRLGGRRRYYVQGHQPGLRLQPAVLAGGHKGHNAWTRRLLAITGN